MESEKTNEQNTNRLKNTEIRHLVIMPGWRRAGMGEIGEGDNKVQTSNYNLVTDMRVYIGNIAYNIVISFYGDKR